MILKSINAGRSDGVRYPKPIEPRGWRPIGGNRHPHGKSMDGRMPDIWRVRGLFDTGSGIKIMSFAAPVPAENITDCRPVYVTMPDHLRSPTAAVSLVFSGRFDRLFPGPTRPLTAAKNIGVCKGEILKNISQRTGKSGKRGNKDLFPNLRTTPNPLRSAQRFQPSESVRRHRQSQVLGRDQTPAMTFAAWATLCARRWWA